MSFVALAPFADLMQSSVSTIGEIVGVTTAVVTPIVSAAVAIGALYVRSRVNEAVSPLATSIETAKTEIVKEVDKTFVRATLHDERIGRHADRLREAERRIADLEKWRQSRADG